MPRCRETNASVFEAFHCDPRVVKDNSHLVVSVWDVFLQIFFDQVVVYEVWQLAGMTRQTAEVFFGFAHCVIAQASAFTRCRACDLADQLGLKMMCEQKCTSCDTQLDVHSNSMICSVSRKQWGYIGLCPGIGSLPQRVILCWSVSLQKHHASWGHSLNFWMLRNVLLIQAENSPVPIHLEVIFPSKMPLLFFHLQIISS